MVPPKNVFLSLCLPIFGASYFSASIFLGWLLIINHWLPYPIPRPPLRQSVTKNPHGNILGRSRSQAGPKGCQLEVAQLRLLAHNNHDGGDERGVRPLHHPLPNTATSVSIAGVTHCLQHFNYFMIIITTMIMTMSSISRRLCIFSVLNNVLILPYKVWNQN